MTAGERPGRGNDPRLMEATLAQGLPDGEAAAGLAAEIGRIDASVAHSAAALDFFDEPAHHAVLLRRLA